MGGTCGERELGASQKRAGLDWSVDWEGKIEKVSPMRSFMICSWRGTEGHELGKGVRWAAASYDGCHALIFLLGELTLNHSCCGWAPSCRIWIPWPCSWPQWIGPGDPWPACNQSDLSLGIWESELRSRDMRIHAVELGWWLGAVAHVYDWSALDPTTFKLIVQLLLGFSDSFICSIKHSLTFKLSWVDFCDLGLEAPSVRSSESQQTPLQASVLSEGNPFS